MSALREVRTPGREDRDYALGCDKSVWAEPASFGTKAEDLDWLAQAGGKFRHGGKHMFAFYPPLFVLEGLLRIWSETLPHFLPPRPQREPTIILLE